MLGKIKTSLRLSSTSNYLLFPDEECENLAKTELLTPDDFCQTNNNNLNRVFSHMNFSLVSYHIDDRNTLSKDCKSKSKVIGVSECRLKTNWLLLPNTNMNKYSHEYTPAESFKEGTLLYTDKNLQYRVRSDVILNKSKKLN